MKRVTVKYCPGSIQSIQTELEKIFAVFSGDSVSHLELNLILDGYAPKEIENIIGILRKMPVFENTKQNIVYTLVLSIPPEISLVHHVTKIRHFLRRVVFVDKGCSDLQFGKVVTAFRKKNILCALDAGAVTSEEIKHLGRKSTEAGVPILTEGFTYTDDSFFELFYQWLYDQQGGRIDLFTDILTKVLMDDWGTRCQYKSCLTKHFYIDPSADVYLCRRYEERICNLFDLEALEDLYVHGTFLARLKQAVLHRRNCREKCKYYGLCHGGCPMEEHPIVELCKDQLFISEMGTLRHEMHRIVLTEDYRTLNPVVRDMILSSAASNKLFEMGLYP